MIIGTAGHIDHGKTTLVRALTGVDTDRLPEEKKRGISIELGYAFLDLPGQERLGFVDVPGHERLVHTMLAGATGLDHALLVIAADDGVMPQTREHLAVLSLLGIPSGAIVITKCDRVAPERIAVLREEIAQLLQGSGFEASPIFEVAALQGTGLDALRAHLASRQGRRTDVQGQGFRLAIDRAFSLDGVGTVVTGTVHAGRVHVGDALRLLPGSEQLLRVRSLHAQNREVGEAHVGQRCAVGLVGIGREAIARGQWLVHPDVAVATSRLDARLRLWPAETRGLRSGASVQLHLGARAVNASLAVLDRELLEPGHEALVQLVLHEPIGAWRGDRVVLRDASASRTLAGGVVLDPFAPARYRRTAARLAELGALQRPSMMQRLTGLLAEAPQELRRFAAAEGCEQVLVPEDGLIIQEAGAVWAMSEPGAQGLMTLLLERLAEHHQSAPEELGLDVARLRRVAAPRLAEPLWRALVQRLRGEGRLSQRGSFLHLPEHGVQLSATEQRIAQKVAPRLAEAGVEGAWARDLARECGEAEALVRTALARLAQQGDLHQVVKDLYYDIPTMVRLAQCVRGVAAGAGGQVLAAAFRDATGLGRKRAIQVLEYFDRVGLLRRVDDVHKLRSDARIFE
ncbi:MAG: selenocysteine-specific translation elongation factor [Paucibacter sp.]|nr:selenocysteine-specific translation elongation factor [Roseateles sp.]